MTERRFDEAEVASIFERATEAQQSAQPQLPVGEGMTLAELQEIGREVGIAPEFLAHAARSLAQSARPATRRFLGFTIGVGRTVDLERKLTEDEWERLIVDLRETFDARGVIKQEGSFRQWTNGNLQALVEPTATGHRVRLRTTRASARGYMSAGLTLIGAAALGALMGIVGDASIAKVLSAYGVVGLMGAGMFAAGALGLPSWARLRQRQMDEIAGRLVLSTSEQGKLPAGE